MSTDISVQGFVNYTWSIICRSRGELSANEKEGKNPSNDNNYYLAHVQNVISLTQSTSRTLTKQNQIKSLGWYKVSWIYKKSVLKEIVVLHHWGRETWRFDIKNSCHEKITKLMSWASIHSNEGLTLDTSASLSLQGENLTPTVWT